MADIKTKTQHCPVCGMDKTDWTENKGQGFSRGSTTYCCKGCADETGCTCKKNPPSMEVESD